jgi:prefoldin subunit 5
MEKWDVEELAERIQQLRRIAEEIRAKGEGIETLEKNVDRILAGVRMLEINIGDVKALL